ncbi:MAG TPA: acetylglutamate kinase, partial [Ruminiclostridium sp.]|nr:acetylglutamate kinase [Ruminiclostridium sp.]
TEFVAKRLLRNPTDFAMVLREFYGEDVVSKFVELFTSHLKIAAELVEAGKAGNSSAAADAERRWYVNANQIANFLNSINPYWSVQEWQKLLYDHLAMTKEEAVHMLGQKYEDSIRIFDEIEQQALLMADTMTQGIVKLFSQQFK